MWATFKWTCCFALQRQIPGLLPSALNCPGTVSASKINQWQDKSEETIYLVLLKSGFKLSPSLIHQQPPSLPHFPISKKNFGKGAKSRKCEALFQAAHCVPTFCTLQGMPGMSDLLPFPPKRHLGQDGRSVSEVSTSRGQDSKALLSLSFFS